MKILIIANSIVGEDPNLTGGEMRFLQIAKRWEKNGHEIHILSSFGAHKLCEKFGLKNAQFHVLSKSARKSRIIFFIRMVQSLFFLPESLKEFNSGIVYSANEQLYDVLPALRIKLRNKLKTRWGVVVHWLPPWPPWKRKNSKFFNSLFFFISERLSVKIADKYADCLLAVSNSTRKQLEKNGNNMDKVFAVECGVEFGLFQSIAKECSHKKYDAVFMKRLMTVKGIYDIIDIWDRVLKNKSGVKLLIIGEGCEEQRVRIAVQNKGLVDCIDFIPRIHEDVDKIRAISSGKVFVLPSYEENWCISAGEAMACNVPVVAYRLEALEDVWKDSIIMVEIGDRKAFALEILKLISDEKELRKREEISAAYVSRYDWDVIASKELDYVLYNKCPAK